MWDSQYAGIFEVPIILFIWKKRNKSFLKLDDNLKHFYNITNNKLWR